MRVSNPTLWNPVLWRFEIQMIFLMMQIICLTSLPKRIDHISQFTCNNYRRFLFEHLTATGRNLQSIGFQIAIFSEMTKNVTHSSNQISSQELIVFWGDTKLFIDVPGLITFGDRS